MTTQIRIVGPGIVDFNFLIYRFGGEPGARDAFEKLVADVVGLVHPDVQEVQANPGDWGIDAFVGELTTGSEVRVWQAKYFIHEFGKSQQADVRESYGSALAASRRHGYVLKAWTLCLPCELDGPNLQWWHGWAKKKGAADAVVIELWTGGGIRRRLLTEEGAGVRELYFSPVFGTEEEAPSPLPRPLMYLPDPDDYTETLFARQMDEAGLVETHSAREAFFNAEILTREIADKGIPAEENALQNWRIRVDATWSDIFNDACQRSSERVPPGIFRQVMDSIEQNHESEAIALRASVLHGTGLMHQSVDNSRAGWVRDWRRVAREHIEDRATPPVNAQEPDATDARSLAESDE